MKQPRPSLGAWLVLLGLFSLPALVQSVQSAQSAQSVPSAESDLAAYADRLLAETYPADEPGAAVLVTHKGKVVLRKGYGLANPELGVPIQPEMVFEIGSVTKQFTASAILMLAERGLLSVEDDITRHLPDYPTHGHKITIEQLLNHTSGIPSYTDMDDWLPKVREDLKVQQLIDIFKDKPLEFAPGERWVYNNSAYILLGAVIEKLSGKTYEDFVEQEILKPLGMTASRYGSNSELVPGRMDGYTLHDEKSYRRAPYLSMTHPYSAGALLSTVDDLALWAEALTTGKLLKTPSLERMVKPARLTSGMPTHYAYGLGVTNYAGRKLIEHGGNTFGFAADILRVPEEQLLIVILSNNNSKNPEPLAFKIAAKALGQPLEERPVLTLDARTRDEYVGVYRFSETLTRTITHEGDRLFAQRSGGQKQELLPTARDEFSYQESGSVLRIRRDGQGDTQGKITGAELEPRFGPSEIGVRTGEPLPSERQAAKVDPATFDAYVGVYELQPGFEIIVTREGDRLFVEPTGQAKREIFPESETKFFLKEVDAQFVFVRGEGGRAESAVLHQGGREMPAKRVK